MHKPKLLVPLALDLNSLGSVREAAAEAGRLVGPRGLNLLVNCGGVSFRKRRLSAEGVEPLLGAYSGYSVEVTAMLIFPFLNMFMMWFPMV